MGRVECARSDCEPLAGKSTLNRMELSANGRDPAKARQITVDFDALDELLVELYLVWGERGQMPKRLVLDIDATDVELHGRQEHRFYHGYYHAYCYLPRLVFCNGWPVRTELRTSSSDVAAGVVETVAPLVDRLRKRFPQVPILIRADGAYCRDELMTWCEARGVDYMLALISHNGWLGCDVCACKLLIPRSWLDFAGGKGMVAGCVRTDGCVGWRKGCVRVGRKRGAFGAECDAGGSGADV